MTSSQIKLLSKMKKLINVGKRRFEQRKDRDYVEDLLQIGLTEEEAWNSILQLSCNFYFADPKPDYYKSGELLTFKKRINDTIVYIKLKIEKSNKIEVVVCLSFHKDFS